MKLYSHEAHLQVGKMDIRQYTIKMGKTQVKKGCKLDYQDPGQFRLNYIFYQSRENVDFFMLKADKM